MKKKGFTLIELLIVIAIIAILAAVVFVALNPLARFKAARDSTRWSDVENILSAIKLHQVDNGGVYLDTINALDNDKYYTIGTCTSGGDSGCTAQTTEETCVDLTGLVTAGYLPSVPKDPVSGTDSKTDYYLKKSATGIITVGACDPEGGSPIEVSR